jgi:hypothetical protein
VADHFEHHTERIKPEHREVRWWILRERLWHVDYFTTEALHELMDILDRCSGLDHESQVLQPDTIPRIRCNFGRRIEEQISARFTPAGRNAN